MVAEEAVAVAPVKAVAAIKNKAFGRQRKEVQKYEAFEAATDS